jgi:7,8-dihydropterin-6-yl-methyl-4-(beta-D-ribofuranosyl)aminobenzene 5'-phosphate synthase
MWRQTVFGSLTGTLSPLATGLLVTGLLVTGCAVRAKDISDSTPVADATPGFSQGGQVEHLTLTIVYDNNAHRAGLRTEWGFACLVETGQNTVLFDTGGKGDVLMGNMAELGIDPQQIEAVVLSHAHGDHTDGLQALLEAGARPTVYVLASFPLSFKNEVRAYTELVEVKAPIEIATGVYSTGRAGTRIPEQALVIEAADGPVVLTGCAHPGLVKMVRRARQVVDQDPALVMGGFHLGGASRSEIEAIIDELRQLGVRQVAPCHCTGDRARRQFTEAWGTDCILAGVGQVIEM